MLYYFICDKLLLAKSFLFLIHSWSLASNIEVTAYAVLVTAGILLTYHHSVGPSG